MNTVHDLYRKVRNHVSRPDDTDTSVDMDRRRLLAGIGIAAVATTAGCMDPVVNEVETRFEQRIQDDIEGMTPEETGEYFLNQRRNYSRYDGPIVEDSIDVTIDEHAQTYDVTVTIETPYTRRAGADQVTGPEGQQIDADTVASSYGTAGETIFRTVWGLYEGGEVTVAQQEIDTSHVDDEIDAEPGTYTIEFDMAESSLAMDLDRSYQAIIDESKQNLSAPDFSQFMSYRPE